MTQCEHNSSTVQADHGNVTLSECDWGCGAILISIEQDGITRTLTADEAYNLRDLVEKANTEAQAIIDNENSHVSMYLAAFSKMETTADENAALRAAYEVACEIFRKQAITLPRLRDAWQLAVQQVEAVGK